MKTENNTQAGFTFVEVMMAMALAGVVALSIGGISEFAMKSQSSLKSSGDVNNFISVVSLQMSDPTRCAAILGTASSQNTLNLSPQGVSTQPAVLTGLPTLPAGVTIVSTTIQNTLNVTAPNGATNWPAQLVFTFQKSGPNGSGNSIITRTVPFLAGTIAYASNPASAPIASCQTTSDYSSPQQVCTTMGWTWNPLNAGNVPPWTSTNQPPCAPNANISCLALNGTYNSVTGTCAGAITSPSPSPSPTAP